MLKDVDSMLVDWSEAILRIQSGGLGFPSRSPIHRMMTEGYSYRGAFGPDTPDRTLPRHVLPVDRVVRRLPTEWIHVLETQYFSERRRRGSRHYKAVDRLHHMIAGGLYMQT